MTDETGTVPAIRTRIFSQETNVWIIATFILTVIVAYTLSFTGFLPTDPITAAIDGFVVALVYVGYRILQAYRVLRLRSKNKIEA